MYFISDDVTHSIEIRYNVSIRELWELDPFRCLQLGWLDKVCFYDSAVSRNQIEFDSVLPDKARYSLSSGLLLIICNSIGHRVQVLAPRGKHANPEMLSSTELLALL